MSIPALSGFDAGELVTAAKLTQHTKTAIESAVYYKPLSVMSAATTPSIPHNTYTKVPVTNVDEDSDGMADASGGRLICQTGGLYRITVATSFVLRSGGSRAVVAYVNGASVPVGLAISATPSGVSPRLSSSGLVRLSVADTLELFVWQNSGSSLNLYSQFSTSALLAAEWVSL